MQKTLSFGVMHVSVAFLVIWAMTGDWRIGGATALIEPLINTLAYHVHEKIWLRKRTQVDATGPSAAGDRTPLQLMFGVGFARVGGQN